MRQRTERQQKRREDILEAARELITERGYAGVTMRDLAARSGVALKTLYLQYDNKENLLTTAVEERHRAAYEEMDAAEIDNGFDRLYFIIETVATSMFENEAYAKTLVPLLARGVPSSSFGDIRRSTYHKALMQIEESGDFLPWVNIDEVTNLIMRYLATVYFEWARGFIETTNIASVVKLHICLALSSLCVGETQRRAKDALEVLFKDSGAELASNVGK